MGIAAPFVVGHDKLVAMPSVTRPALLECAGNNRAFLLPQASGMQREQSEISNPEWTGLLLEALLERANLRESAEAVTDVLLAGLG